MKFKFNPIYSEATDEEKMAQLRNWRNIELSATDWTQLPDSPVDKESWAHYRQALRDLPESAKFPDEIELPEVPGGTLS